MNSVLATLAEQTFTVTSPPTAAEVLVPDVAHDTLVPMLTGSAAA